MRYQIRQRIFSLSDSFTIKDEIDEPKFIVKGRVFSLGDKLSLQDLYGNELFYIEQKLFKFLPEYHIYQNGILVAKVKKEFTFFKPKFFIDSQYGAFDMTGDIIGYNFQITRNGIKVATVNKKWFAFSDTYGVEIDDSENQAFLLALVIVIDQVIHDNKHNH
ncbi:MAG: LURP-one-related family protein [Caloramator sp.]|nr:LURP-one-related family protein [Caloramator sp.]